MQTYQSQSKKKLISIIVTVLVIAGTVVLIDHLKADGSTSTAEDNTATASTSQSASTTSQTTTQASTSTSYADGTYTASSDYYVPHGDETISVTVTLKDGVITSSSLQNSENDHDSQRYQEDFTSLYKSYVVGKNISGLRLNTLAGASDTTQGFNDALSQIASRAQA